MSRSSSAARHLRARAGRLLWRVEFPERVRRERAIVVRDLRKSYGGVQAVRGVSFEVARGEVFCLLGPNGPNGADRSTSSSSSPS
jgi:ABC-type glutathione transport system ATPase component